MMYFRHEWLWGRPGLGTNKDWLPAALMSFTVWFICMTHSNNTVAETSFNLYIVYAGIYIKWTFFELISHTDHGALSYQLNTCALFNNDTLSKGLRLDIVFFGSYTEFVMNWPYKNQMVNSKNVLSHIVNEISNQNNLVSNILETLLDNMGNVSYDWKPLQWKAHLVEVVLHTTIFFQCVVVWEVPCNGKVFLGPGPWLNPERPKFNFICSVTNLVFRWFFIWWSNIFWQAV